MKNVVLTVFVCNFCITLTYDLWMLAILKNTFFICNLCSYSTVKHDAFQWLQFLQLFTAIQCSGTLHAVGHCNKNQIAVVWLYFHCKITAKVCSVHSLQIANVYHFETVSVSLKFRALSQRVNVFQKDWRTLNSIRGRSQITLSP